jgi:hypothetical protein
MACELFPSKNSSEAKITGDKLLLASISMPIFEPKRVTGLWRV